MLERSCLVSAAWIVEVANKQWTRAFERRIWALAEWLIMLSIKKSQFAVNLLPQRETLEKSLMSQAELEP